MSAQPRPTPLPEEPEYRPYPGYGSDEDTQARIRLIEWIGEQLGEGKVEVRPGDYVLATEWRILGVGPDLEELNRRAEEAEPAIARARVVAHRITTGRVSVGGW